MTLPSRLATDVPATTHALAEAEALAADILQDIELGSGRLSVVALRALRLARILNDFEAYRILEWESSGYPSEESGVAREVWQAGKEAGRTFYKKDSSDTSQEFMYMESIEQLEQSIDVGTAGLQAAQDPSVSISSANQRQFVTAPAGNVGERNRIRSGILTSTNRLAARRTLIYDYACRKYYELKFGGVADDVFGRIRSAVDDRVGSVVPDSVQKFTAVYEYLKSENPEDWANAAHSCRRILQDLADAVFPAQSEVRNKNVDGKGIQIKLGVDQYINRLVAYVEDNSDSERFEEIVGSQLRYLGDRLDALFYAAQKGSHANVTMEEANRCVVYTYLIVGDFLSLVSTNPATINAGQIGGFAGNVVAEKRPD